MGSFIHHPFSCQNTLQNPISRVHDGIFKFSKLRVGCFWFILVSLSSVRVGPIKRIVKIVSRVIGIGRLAETLATFHTRGHHVSNLYGTSRWAARDAELVLANITDDANDYCQ